MACRTRDYNYYHTEDKRMDNLSDFVKLQTLNKAHATAGGSEIAVTRPRSCWNRFANLCGWCLDSLLRTR